MFDWLQSLYENALANAERRIGGYEDPENRWGILVAVLAAFVIAWAIHRYLSKGRSRRQDQDRDDDARWDD